MINKLKSTIFLTTLLSVFIYLPKINAQEIKGIVHELESSQRVSGVLVKNINNKTETTTDAEGNFKIKATINDYLTFTQAGYEVDTAFVYEEGVQRIYLVRDQKSIVIDEVVISRLTDSRLVAEIEKAKREGQVTETSQNKGGLRLSPSRLFGRQSKQARQSLDLLLSEQRKRKVDRIFSNKMITSVVPVSEGELPLFKEQFRPTLEFIEKASPEDIRVYLLDAYSKFKSK
ncbi:hypothetical protein [Sphingobacterium sp. LRF_L2]|uniref:hypothetical protein n=1 Tax=Sphingobacterium sp. LRF_L2 TaxID=3369421 RepID=UPI003F614640